MSKSARNRWWCFESTEIEYELLDPGVREVVRWLVGLGFNTTDSGDGEFKRAHGWSEEDGMVSHPHVMMQVEPELIAINAGNLVEHLKRAGIKVVSQTDAWAEVIDAPHEIKPKPYIEVTYDPVDDRAIMGLYYVTSDMMGGSR